MRMYGIIGYPLGHSFSKNYFAEKFAREGITDCCYEVFPMETIEEFEPLLLSHPELHGLNITIPHKQSVLRFLDDTTNLPATLRACNCIKIDNGKLTGYNTDIIGFERSLQTQLQTYHTKALVLGNGGAAAAVKFVLNKLGIEFRVISRKKNSENDLTYTELNESIIKDHLLIINTTPLGTFPNVDECPAIPYQYLTAKHFLYDLVYNPEKTLFLQKGEERGAVIKNGYDMLVIQAEESWRIWTSAD